MEFGEPIISYYGIKLLNPVKGFLVKISETAHTYNWGIIPIENYQVPKDLGDLIFGELIEAVYSRIKRSRYDKYPEESLLKTIEDLKSAQLRESEIDRKTKELLNLAEK